MESVRLDTFDRYMRAAVLRVDAELDDGVKEPFDAGSPNGIIRCFEP
jgi:hypothetical protein